MDGLKKFGILLTLTGIVGCSSPEQSRLTGQFIGLVAGAVVGSQFSQGHGTFVAVSEGVWLGFHLGGLFGDAVTSNSADYEPDSGQLNCVTERVDVC
jgi:uncharacterized protein YcfJ